ncbi:protein of unknown function [Roseovarius azorensis]|uniref:DUF4160 domain-containing protein n=1 Tax=Roseovarius azorensis TaxID=1287727 RepID=A0A1H7XIV5_9RHOB|nr:DUF4160 domain-containing protein [Roseovarius azorensis]SEM33832.1 protein of unknown function [Roseovarius azorensis]
MTETVVPFEDESVESLLSDMNLADMLEPRRGSLDHGHTEFLVKRFNGIKIEIFANEHPPPHFRVKTNAGTGNFSIDTCEPLHGADAVMRRHREVKKWHEANRKLLIETWNKTRPSQCTVGKFRG